MATEEFHTEHHKDATAMPVRISQDRRMIGLEAVWEIDALNQAIDALCSDLGSSVMAQHDLMSLRLQVRGLTARIDQLNHVAMSILDEDGETVSLARRVLGRGYESVDPLRSLGSLPVAHQG